jgi:hypothetical protein
MKTFAIAIVMFILALPDASAQPASARDSLPQYVSIELKRIEETWCILDSIATTIWPGWTSYVDVPFLFTYPNGVQILIGHPNPPEGFTAVHGLELRGKKVMLDRRKEIPLAMPLPLNGGGGPIPFGYQNGKPVTVVRIDSRSFVPPAETGTQKATGEDFRLGSENQILINIHELFHCFQNLSSVLRVGNLRFNTDENYSAYAEIEGLALERAYLESNSAAAMEFLKDFIVARRLKRTSMTELEGKQESSEDVAEGTATYSELMTATLVNDKFPHAMTQKDDPHFFHFRYADSLKHQKLTMLRSNRTASLSSRDKCYSFGCFQAMLLTRFSPHWRDGFLQKGGMLDKTIDSLCSLSADDQTVIAARLKSRYGYDTIYARHASVLGARNRAYEMIQKRQGLTFVVNFKNTGEFPIAEGYAQAPRLGLINIYPTGIKKIRIADVLFEGKETPMVNDQIYYVKWIDTEAKEGQKRYEIQGDQEGTSTIYKNAVFKTDGFTLTAPKIEVRETKGRVKVIVLAKVKQ